MAFTGTEQDLDERHRWCRWKDATIHVAAHVLHYGTGVFEGIRAYETKHGCNVFRLPAHAAAQRFLPRLSHGPAMVAARAVGRRGRNGSRQRLQELLHPAAGLPRLGTARPRPELSPVEGAIVVWEWRRCRRRGPREGHRRRRELLDRLAPNTMPGLAKATANYANSGADQDAGHARRLRRGHRPGRARAGQRRQRAESLPGSRRVIFTPAIGSSVLKGSPRQRDARWPGPRGRGARVRDPPRNPLHAPTRRSSAAPPSKSRRFDRSTGFPSAPDVAARSPRPSRSGSSALSAAMCQTRTAG